ncbi:acyltransferas-like protein [Lentithecium fluviatile CBS 122367]|uniref:Acyltransferas-like protein n=1 Tax=Lentithecium fluviatile CBS 122367 TaxID=1168545 RepID=A0A6G1IPJ1_9PLEO|nr:acyltransferas-like protein [Lentithecium fluviatile CBS 122367]
MPSKFDGPLDHGRMEEIKLNSATWKPMRPSRWSLDIIRPEFFALRPSSPKKPIRHTAWLDGLRGFAAFMVYLHHNQLWAHGFNGNIVYENSFGYEGKHYFAALPFVRHFFSGGHYAVSIFFVISGYVLSVKSLGLIQRGQQQNAADSVGSALFRRWLRLYIPVIAVTFLWMSQRHWTGLWVDFGIQKDTYWEQLWDWYTKFKNYSFAFLTGNIYEFPILYHPHSWSIPIEFKGSVIVYTALLAFSRCTRNARLWCEAGLAFYFLYIVDGWYGALFMVGMLLCDLDLLALDDQLPRVFSTFAEFKELIFFHLFLVALYLGGVPSCDGPNYEGLLPKSPGWKWLSHLKPQAVYDAKWFFLFWAAFLTVASIPRLPWLKQFFETRFCQYLARISFALYLVHGLVIYSLGDRLYAAVGLLSKEHHKERIPGWIDIFPISKKGPMGFELAFWVPQLIILPVTLWAAEVVTKLIDEPSVKFANWLYKKTLAPPSSPKHG